MIFRELEVDNADTKACMIRHMELLNSSFIQWKKKLRYWKHNINAVKPTQLPINQILYLLLLLSLQNFHVAFFYVMHQMVTRMP